MRQDIYIYIFFIKARQVETRGDKRIRDKTRSEEKTRWRSDGTRGYLGTRQGKAKLNIP